MLTFYRLFSWLVAPFVPILLWMRARKGKEIRHRIPERKGRHSPSRPKRPEGKLIWFHAASMGEAASIVPLIKKILEQYPNVHVLMTTVTVTSARNVGAKLPERALHQFAPVDTPLAIRRFLKYWQPDIAFWVESEFWPNMMAQTHATGCPMVLLNARISRRSFDRWQKLRPTIEKLLSYFTLVLAKSDEDAGRLRNLGAKKVEVRGNLKFSSPALHADPKAASEILELIDGRRIWLASSTHSGEEEMIAKAHRHLKLVHTDLLTVIVPRHDTRGREIATLLQKQGHKVALRSQNQVITPNTDIYVADTMGELGLFYRLAGIVFIGGSLVPHGGQNPFEPALLDCAILYGPHMENFSEFCHELEIVHGAVPMKNADELEVRVGDLLRDQTQQEAIASAALTAVKAKQNVIQNVLESLTPHLAEAGISTPKNSETEEAGNGTAT